MNMKVRKLAVVILAKERESCRELFEGITLGCSNERIKPAEIISTFLCPCSVEQFEYILNNDDCCPNFAEYFAGAEYRLIIAADTEAQDFLETLRGVVAHSAFRYDQTMQILSLSDVVADACHARGITNICIQRTDSGATDLRLEQRLPDKLIRPYAVTGAINQDLRQLRDDALQQEKDKRRDAPVFDAFWNAWRMVLLGQT